MSCSARCSGRLARSNGPTGRLTALRWSPHEILVLLKLYAGGTQDLWDVRALLELPEGPALVAQVDEDLADLPADMRARWIDVRR